jgi:hypothetical protein
MGFTFARLALAALLCATAASVIAAASSRELPAGWGLEGDELVWTSSTPLRMGGARHEFRSGKRVLGYPVQRGDSLRLRISPSEPLTDLSVWAAGRRIDMPAATLRQAPATVPAEPTIGVTAFDPALPGPYQTERLRYRLPRLAIAEFPASIEVLAEVTAPVDDPASLPVVLLLHGRHSTCYRGGPTGDVSGDWPCPEGWRAVPSYTGYRYMADVLASQGYLVVSISANGINGQDGLFMDGGAFARSRLVRHHLAQWAEWSTFGGDPWGGRFHGRVDLDQIVLVGHSRGGEGVERAAIDSHEDDPWKIRGLVLIGPTAFGRQVAAGIHTTVILPFCDGDVADLQGQQYVDIGRDLTRDRALRSSIMAMGTNHNFYNTEWTPGLSKSPAWDDWFDPDDSQCGENRERRLTPPEQQSVGLAYTAALVDLALRVRSPARRLLDGTRLKPPSIGRASTSVHAIGGNKRLLYAAGKGTDVSARWLVARECRGYYLAGPFDLRPGCMPDFTFQLIPHWTPMSFAETSPGPRALEVAWDAPGGVVSIPISAGSNRTDALDLRVAGVPKAAAVEFDVRVRDAAGRWAYLEPRPLRLRSYFGPSPLGKVVARQLRASLEDAAIASADITAVELIPRSPRGRFWLLDVSAWRNGPAASDQIHLPRVSVGDVVVQEGDSGQRTLEVPVHIDGAVTKQAQVWVQLTDYADFEQPTRGIPLVLEPGTASASIPYAYQADDVYDPVPRLVQVALLARRNAVTGDFDGTILVEEDEPPPVLSVDARRVTVREGTSLTWTFRLSEPLANGAGWSIEFMPAAGGQVELDSDDVPASFLEAFGIIPPDPAVPLWQLGIFLSLEFAPGDRVATVSIPIAADHADEDSESVVLLLDGFGDPVIPNPIELTGVVTDD